MNKYWGANRLPVLRDKQVTLIQIEWGRDVALCSICPAIKSNLPNPTSCLILLPSSMGHLWVKYGSFFVYFAQSRNST